MPKQVKQGKYLWSATVRQVGVDFRTTYTLSSDAHISADFNALAKRALDVARKDKGSWSSVDTATLYVVGIEYIGPIIEYIGPIDG